MSFDLQLTPFARYGNYHSIGPRPAKGAPLGDGLYLHSHHASRLAARDLARLDLLTADGQVVEPQIKAGFTELVLEHGPGARVRVCWTLPDVMRVHGEGAGLRLTVPAGPGVVAHPGGDGRWVVNARKQLRRYMFEPLRGQLKVDAPWKTDQCDRIVLEILPGPDGLCELAVDDFLTAWRPRPRPGYEELTKEVAGDFAAWLKRQPSAPRKLKAAWEHAAYVNWSAVVAPCGHFKRPAMLMSKHQMDNVWSWDHCFNAMALCYHDPELAWDQLLVVMDHQDEFGALPDAMNDCHMHYNYSKPPVHGWALSFMLSRNRALNKPERLRALYPRLARWSEFWLTDRTAPGERLPYYLHGNDSGWGNSTMFDLGAPLVAPDLAAVLTLQLETLAGMAARLGRKREAQKWAARAAGLCAALLEELWRGDHFVARLQATGREVHCESLIPCVPLALGRRLPAEVAAALVARLKGFLTENGLATERPGSPHYSPDGYWRGPIWAPPTLLIVTGLWELGEKELAQTIARRFCDLCARSGFAENFDALTGAGLRDHAYTWTSSTFLILAHEYV